MLGRPETVQLRDTDTGILSKIHWTFRESLGKLQGFLGKVWGFLGKLHLKLSGNFRDTVREDLNMKSIYIYIYTYNIHIHIYV